MNAEGMFQSEDDDFGPGTALVLSLFAVLLLIVAMGWADAIGARGALPKRLMAITEGEGGHSLFNAGEYSLTPRAKGEIAAVVRSAVEMVRQQQLAHEQTSNHLQVIGYASPEGKGNEQLAERRALSVRDYLVFGLGVPAECVVVANYSDSHSNSLRKWLDKGNRLTTFRALAPNEQIEVLGVNHMDIALERRVEILGVYHSDSTCRLDLVTLR
jgi:outer membrane protein OmpA-like peptidoglycan-associated protein